MSSNVEKKKTLKPSLPNDLLLSCLARVSRLDYPTLSLVSKTFRSLLASPELYKTRSLLGHTESCLYVSLRFYPNTNPRWYTLGRNPKTLTNHLVQISIPNCPNGSSQVVLGSKIYDIGGCNSRDYLSRMSILDCWTHKWCEGPSMQVERCYPAVNVFDGKIYVAGGCKECNPSTWMEVFDPKTQIWECVLCPLAESFGSRVYKSAVIKGTIYMFGKEHVTYKPMEDRWEAVKMINLDDKFSSICYCAIDDILYSYRGGFKWYDIHMRSWIVLNGLRNFESGHVSRLVDYGGKMAVFFHKFVSFEDYTSKEIHCAVIALERRNNYEIRGKIEWSGTVLTVTVPKDDYMFIEKALDVTV